MMRNELSLISYLVTESAEEQGVMIRKKILIVDDEPLGRERIRHLLEQRADVEVTAEAVDGREAVEQIRSNPFDLVFLDIQMPHMSGIDVVKEIGPENMPAVIFSTAYDEYAIEAFQVHALDYLLKPFESDRFQASLDRVLELLSPPDSSDLEQRLTQFLEADFSKETAVSRFMIKSHQQISFVQTKDIDWIEAAGNYVNLHVGKDSHLLRLTMKEIEGKLDPDVFLRIHRSSIVNLNAVLDLKQMFNGEYEVRLESGAKLTMSRNYRKNLDRFA